MSGQNLTDIQQPNQFLWSFIFDGSDLTRHGPKGLILTKITLEQITFLIKANSTLCVRSTAVAL